MMKQRIYGFLLRRILGPYLSTASLEKLHNSIDIAISEGKFILKDVDFDCTHLNTLSNNNNNNVVSVQKATVQKLAIFISLRNSSTNPMTDDDESSWQSSISKMYRLGYRETGDPNHKTGGGASLHVHIELEGIQIELGPSSTETKTSIQDQSSNKETEEKEKTKSSTSFVGSYIEAALNSLRLSFNMTQISIRFSNSTTTTFLQQQQQQESSPHPTTTTMELKVATVSYRDIYKTSGISKRLHTNNDEEDDNVICIPEIILHKEITFSNLSVVVGTRESEEIPFHILEHDLIHYHGMGNIQVHIASYPTDISIQQSQNKKKTQQLKREINIALKESIHVDMDHTNIFILKRLVDSFAIVHNEEQDCTSQNHTLETTTKQQTIIMKKDDNDYRASLLATEDDVLNNVENKLGLLRNIVGDYDGRRGSNNDETKRIQSNNDMSLEQSSSLDDFFDANDLGFSHYQSVLASCQNLEDYDDDDSDTNIIHTKLSLDLREIRMKIFTRRNFPGTLLPLSEYNHLEPKFTPVDNNMYTELVLKGCELLSSISKDKYSITSSISYLDLKECSRKFIQHTSSGIDIPLHSTSLLHFEERLMDDRDNISVLDSGKPLFIHILSNKSEGCENSQNLLSVDISLQPLEIVYVKSCIDNILSFSEKLKEMENKTEPKLGDPNSANNDNPSPMDLVVKIDSLTVLIPIENDEYRANKNKENLESLLRRSTTMLSKYYNSKCGVVEIGWTFDDICFSVNKKMIMENENHFKSDISLTCERSLIFIRSTDNEYMYENEMMSVTRVFDVVSFSGQTSIDPNALVRIEIIDQSHQNNYTDSQRQSNFPFVTPLHTVKATQQNEYDDDICDPIIHNDLSSDYEFAKVDLKPNNNNNKKKNVRGSDPQYEMFNDAKKSKIDISVHIPSISLDATDNELSAILHLVKSISPNNDVENAVISVNDDLNSQKDDDDIDIRPAEVNYYSLTFQCDQLTLSLKSVYDGLKNNDTNGEIETDESSSFMVAFDKVKAHILVGPDSLKHCRLLSNDITLYEVRNQSAMYMEESHEAVPLSRMTLTQRTKNLRKRQYSLPKSVSKPIFYRSKLSHPLSPETPAFLLDILVNKNNFFDSEERAVHLSIYDVTYRYDLDSCWMEGLIKILKCCSPSVDDENNESSSTSVESDEVVSVINLFVTVSDCCIDYTPPENFRRHCRGILRVSEMRVSSNVVMPFGPVQAFKVSIVDVSFYLSNARIPYNAENSRLSCAKFVMHQLDLSTNSNRRSCEPCEKSFDDALYKMRFVNIASVDCIDTMITIASSIESERVTSNTGNGPQAHPLITASLSVGQVSLSMCHDSFRCFVDMFGELMIKLTMPSEEEIREMRLKTENTPNELCDPPTKPENQNIRLPDALEDNTGFKNEQSGNPKSMDYGNVEASKSFSPNNTTQSSLMIDTPDSELSASQLRMKYHSNVSTLNETKIDIEKSLLIKNFYTLERSNQDQNNEETMSDSRNISKVHDNVSDFVGSGWTTVDHEWSRNPDIPIGQEQVAHWYQDESDSTSHSNEIHRQSLSNYTATNNPTNTKNFRDLQIFPQHVPINPVSDPLSGGDMNAAKFAGTKNAPEVKLRLIVKDLSLNCFFYDGFDWPHINTKYPTGTNREDDLFDNFDASSQIVNFKTKNEDKFKAIRSSRARSKLLNSLVDDGLGEDEYKNAKKSSSSHQKPALLPQPKRRMPRQNERFFQLSATGLKLRLDSFQESQQHSLCSCMDLSISDMFLAETISSGTPVKILGEWFNEIEHPRDSNDGILMMKVVSMRPKTKFSADGKLMSDESKVSLELLPLRCIFHQSAIRFIRSFFSSNDDETSEEDTEFDTPAEAFFQHFKVLPCKLKVDYIPLGVDTNALRDGAYVELINLLPLEDMVLTLKLLEMQNITGWGTAFGEISCRWLEDICATQLHKFITNSSPFKPFSHVGAGAANMVIIPLEEAKCNGPVVSALRKGTASFAGAIAFETLTTTAKLTKFAAKKLSRLSLYRHLRTADSFPVDYNVTPRNINAAARPAIASLSKGLKEANAKIIIIPYREYQRVGTSGAVKSVLKGIPVAICAPLSGASEALSYTLIGARNQLYPSAYKEEEANLRGLSSIPYSTNL